MFIQIGIMDKTVEPIYYKTIEKVEIWTKMLFTFIDIMIFCYCLVKIVLSVFEYSLEYSPESFYQIYPAVYANVLFLSDNISD